MPYWIYAKVKDSAFSVVVETAHDALAKVAELTEAGHIDVTIKDLSGAEIEPNRLLADAVGVGE